MWVRAKCATVAGRPEIRSYEDAKLAEDCRVAEECGLTRSAEDPGPATSTSSGQAHRERIGVLKQWLSHRERKVLERAFRVDEVEYFGETARRIVAVLLLGNKWWIDAIGH